MDATDTMVTGAEAIHHISTLPNEIISEIFLHFLPIYPQAPPLRGLLSPTLLTHICRRWRDIAHATPALWRAISLRLNALHDEQDNELLESWTARSRSHPISISIGGDGPVASQCMKTLAAHRGRWENVEFLWLDEHSLPFLCNPMPLLQHLNMSFRGDYDPVIIGDAPLLRSARIGHRVNNLVLPWRQLTSLALQSLYLDESIPILQQSVFLVHCELALFIRPHHGDDYAGVELPFLQSLVLTGRNTTARMPSLHTLILPALRTLQINGSGLGPRLIPGLAAFFLKSGCALRGLRITGKGSEVAPDEYRKAFPTISEIIFE
ncbi:hypothetical protein C8R43DRAFT_991536 [Mycena crocata]|nr:hypothetical protein C8R43DRAFT_991536 [Mycena crocata]